MFRDLGILVFFPLILLVFPNLGIRFLKSETGNVKLNIVFVKSDENAQYVDNHWRRIFSPFKFDWHPGSESVQGNAYGHSNY